MCVLLSSLYIYGCQATAKTFLLVYTQEKYNPLKASLCVLTASSDQWSLPAGGEGGVLGPELGLLVLVPHLLHDADEVLQAEHIPSVRPVVHGGVIPEALERAVCKVDHADVHLGGGHALEAGAAGAARAGARAAGWRHLGQPRVQVLETHLGAAVQAGLGPALLAVVDDEQGAGVEAVGGLPLQHRFQAPQFAQDGLKKVTPQVQAVVQVLVEGIAEAFDGEPPAIVLVPAEVMPRVQLVHLKAQETHR